MKFSSIALSIASVLACSGLAAQDIHFGGQVTLAKPMGDLGGKEVTVSDPSGVKSQFGSLDGKFGYGLGIHALIDLKNGHAIVPKIDYTTFKNSQDSTVSISGVSMQRTDDVKVTAINLGADYNYFLGGKTSEGFYFLGGLGYSSAKLEATRTARISGQALTASDAPTKSAFYLQAGLGYFFTPRMGAELRYVQTTYSDVTLAMQFGSEPKTSYKVGDLSAPSIQASFVLRF